MAIKIQFLDNKGKFDVLECFEFKPKWIINTGYTGSMYMGSRKITIQDVYEHHIVKNVIGDIHLEDKDRPWIQISNSSQHDCLWIMAAPSNWRCD